MRIVIANKFYYERGGDCIMSIGLERLLKQNGHEVAFFSMQFPDNFASPWSGYFPSEVDFGSGGVKSKMKAVKRLFRSSEVASKFNRLLDDFCPDVVHLNNIHSQLSPIIGKLAHDRGIRVVWTMHDYKLLCPSYSCLLNGKICEQCVGSGLMPLIKNKCMKGSLLASTMAFMEAKYWNLNRLVNQTDAFIAPSQFMRNKLIQGGVPSEKISVLYNFTNRVYPEEVEANKEDYYCFVGRLDEIKGVRSLIKVANTLSHRLVVIGTGPLSDELCAEANGNIEFLGFKNWEGVLPILSKARFLVVPSEWNEVWGLVSIEAQALGTPVLASRVGGLAETVEKTEGGMLFEHGDEDGLRGKIEQMFSATFDYGSIANKARDLASAERYYEQLMKVYCS